MKKKIVLGLSLFALMFLVGGFYIVTTMERTILELHGLSQLHHTIALRKNLLASVERDQDKIKLRGTRYAERVDADEAVNLTATINRCLNCHRTGSPVQTIHDLKNQIEEYQRQAQVILNPAPLSPGWERQADAALQLGNGLIRRIEGIMTFTSMNLEKRELDILGKIKKRKNLLFLLVTVGPFFAIGLAFYLINGIAGPVKSLLEATRRLKAGDLDHRIRGLQGEFGEVADSFNDMVASLKKQMQELQRTEQLRVCGEMAAGLAHEIRNPLAGIKVSIEVLLAELNLEERDKAVLAKIIEQIRHMELLIRNLLNYARPVAAQPTTVNVNQILNKTISFIAQHPSFISGNSRKKIVPEIDPDLPETICDPQQLQQVFLNLFLNAADAITEGGTITARTHYEKKDETIVIELQDTGKGISEELREKIFQPFFTTKGKGTGLGLAVSKRLVEEHGGTIEALNNAGAGATFRVILPVKSEEMRG